MLCVHIGETSGTVVKQLSMSRNVKKLDTNNRTQLTPEHRSIKSTGAAWKDMEANSWKRRVLEALHVHLQLGLCLAINPPWLPLRDKHTCSWLCAYIYTLVIILTSFKPTATLLTTIIFVPVSWQHNTPHLSFRAALGYIVNLLAAKEDP